MDFTKLGIGNDFAEGEKSLVRRIRFDDMEEMRRMRIIEDDPGVAEFVEDLQATEEELVRFAKSSENNLCVGVVGKEGCVPQEEVDKLQGWIYFSPDEEERLFRLKETGLLGGSFDGTVVSEISYAKYPGASSGQMSSVLRQMIKILKRKCGDLAEQMILTAYTDTRNENSSRLLTAAGFQKIGKLDYHVGAERPDDVWILRLY